jgi:hypothetical protein
MLAACVVSSGSARGAGALIKAVASLGEQATCNLWEVINMDALLRRIETQKGIHDASSLVSDILDVDEGAGIARIFHSLYG